MCKHKLILVTRKLLVANFGFDKAKIDFSNVSQNEGLEYDTLAGAWYAEFSSPFRQAIS